jgi:hypothetical protein
MAKYSPLAMIIAPKKSKAAVKRRTPNGYGVRRFTAALLLAPQLSLGDDHCASAQECPVS